ncbi:hypothetical protein MJD09_20270 [bacterium]|nr:hypothetical protein [bacterium]
MLLEKLAGGDRKSIGRAKEIAYEVLQQPDLLQDLMRGFFVDDPIVRARSAVATKQVVLARPDLIQPYKERLLSQVAQIDQWEVREQFAIIFPKLKLTPRDIDRVIPILKDYLNYYSSIVRTCAMQALVDLAEIQPSFEAEVVPIIKELTETGTAAMRARGRKLLKVLAKRNEP